MTTPVLYRTGWPASQAWDAERWPHFTAKEFTCKCGLRYCGGEYMHSPDFLDAMEFLKTAMHGAPIIINSGHRCATWNRLQGGSKNSMHLTIAADIRIDPHDRHELLKAAEDCGFTGIGLAVNFLHVDRRERPARWDYGPASRRAWGLSPV